MLRKHSFAKENLGLTTKNLAFKGWFWVRGRVADLPGSIKEAFFVSAINRNPTKTSLAGGGPYKPQVRGFREGDERSCVVKGSIN